jgi:hypothetical protein
MRIIFMSVLVSSALGTAACGKKAEPAPDAAIAVKPEAKSDVVEAKPEAKSDVVEAKPEAKSDVVEAKSDVVEAKSDVVEAKSDAVEAKSDVVEANAGALPGYWAPLFVSGKSSTWAVTEAVVASEMDDEGKQPPKVTKKDLAGKITCNVNEVVMSDGVAPGATDKGKLWTSQVECTGYEFANGVEEGPMGTWLTNGKSLWKKIGEVTELRLEAEPTAKTTKDEEIEVIWSAGDAGTWCFKMNILIGDGGVLEAYFDKDKGPVKFFGHGGSAAVDSKVTVTLVP